MTSIGPEGQTERSTPLEVSDTAETSASNQPTLEPEAAISLSAIHELLDSADAETSKTVEELADNPPNILDDPETNFTRLEKAAYAAGRRAAVQSVREELERQTGNQAHSA